MSQKQHTELNEIMTELSSQLNPRAAMVVREAIAVQIYTAREARDRIDREGSVVRDTKGAVVPHPAIKIEADAIKMYTALIAKHGRYQ